MLHPQWLQRGAMAWMAHSKESKVPLRSPEVIVIALSYLFPHTSHVFIELSFGRRRQVSLHGRPVRAPCGASAAQMRRKCVVCGTGPSRSQPPLGMVFGVQEACHRLGA
jgi:hypothetical protein